MDFRTSLSSKDQSTIIIFTIVYPVGNFIHCVMTFFHQGCFLHCNCVLLLTSIFLLFLRGNCTPGSRVVTPVVTRRSAS